MRYLHEAFKDFLRAKVLTWRGATMGSLAFIFFWILVPVVGPHVISPTFKLDVRSVTVEDSRMGVSPAVAVDRDINSTFQGGYVATLKKIDDTGFVYNYCEDAGRSEIQFKQNSPYPGRNLSWWLGDPPNDDCARIEVGKYVLRLEWTLPFFWGMVQVPLVRESIPFQVFDPIPLPKDVS